MSGTQRERAAAPTEPASPAGALVGREAECLALSGRLGDPTVRLLTLTGPAGVGKSRLAAWAVEREAAGFARVRVLDLAGGDRLTGEDAGIPAGPEPSAAEPSAAEPGRSLLVLDGCDHAARPTAEQLSALLRDHPGLVVLATGLEPQRVAGERVMPVAALPVPEEGEEDPQVLDRVPSVALLVRRARDAAPDFALTEANAAPVAEICRRLAGLPLAVELAAERLRVFPPQLLAVRLRERTTGLAGGPATAPERHRSLGALAAWSCQGLDPAARALLDEVAVHAAGLPASEVGRSAESALQALVDRAVLTVVEGPEAEPRFAVAEPVRSHVWDELEAAGRLEAALDAHAERYRRLLAGVEPRLAGTDQAVWLRTLAAREADLLAALRRWDERGEVEVVAVMLTALRLPWLVRGRAREGLEWCDRLAAADAGRLPASARVRLADLAGAFALALDDAGEAVRRHRLALELGRSLGDRRRHALSSLGLGTALLASGDGAGAQVVLAAALASLESLGAAGPAAEAAAALARVMRERGERRRARELLDGALAAARRLRDRRALAGILLEAAAFAQDEGETDTADRSLRECLLGYREVGELSCLPVALETYALLVLTAWPEQQPRVVRLLAAAAALRGRLGTGAGGPRAADVAEALEGLRARLSWNAFTTAWQEGARLTPAGAVDEALSSPSPGRGTAVSAGPETPSLTPRQVQVAMLVAEGMTNRQIAARLEISEWTVVNHVRQVMRRLNCASRVQVAWTAGRWPR